MNLYMHAYIYVYIYTCIYVYVLCMYYACAMYVLYVNVCAEELYEATLNRARELARRLSIGYSDEVCAPSAYHSWSGCA